MTRALPSFLRDLLACPPQAGEGVHVWLFKVARQLHTHLPAGDIVTVLEERVAGCGRAVPRSEIVAAVQGALATAWTPSGRSGQGAPTRRWPPVDAKLRASVIANGYGLADLWEESRVRLDTSDNRSEQIIDRLFPGNPLLCCGASSREFDTKPRNEWRGHLAGLQLIVPSPMAKPRGLTKDGRESAHTLDNTGPRRFLVVEQDQGTLDEQAAVLLHLATKGPLVCAVHSGGKSLHGWFAVPGKPEAEVEAFFRYAVRLGADPALWTRSQFARMPDGTRDNGRRQTVYFLNFKPLEGA